jgi:uncharacterized protein HemY/transcriptional regulator with XRE-family HTH domain
MKTLHTASWKDRLRQERIQRNLRQHDLAEQLGTSVATIQRWERGSHQPSAYFRVKLCALFGKSAQELGFVSDDSSSNHSQVNGTGMSETRVQVESAQRTARADHGLALFDVPVDLRDPAIPASPLKEDALVGRTNEFHLLKQHILTHTGSLALYGLPGVGKTALAIALAHDRNIAAHFHDGILWAGLGREPDRFHLLSRWGSLLGLSAAEMTTAKTRNLDALAEMLRDAIGSRRILLVLDDAWEITTALDFKVGGSQCVHLVTTRFPPVALHFADKFAFSLRELNEQDSITLLQQLAPSVMTDEFGEVHELIRAVGGLPLALTLMGKYLQVQAHDHQPRRLHKALERLRCIDTRLRLTIPQSPVDHHPSLPSHTPLSLQAVIEISEQQLDPQARERFRTLSVFPARPNSFSEAAAMTICGLSEADLDQFTDAGLLESHSPGRYTLHQTIADYARQHCAHKSVEEQMVLFFVALIKDNQQDYDLLEQEYTNILTAFEVATRTEMAVALQQGVNQLAPFLIARGLYTPGMEYLNRAKHAAELTGSDEELVRSWFYLGRIVHFRGDLPLAEHHYREGLVRARRLENKELICQLLDRLGEVVFDRGDWRSADRYLQEGLKLAQALGQKSIMAHILRILGEIAGDYHGDTERASACSFQGLELARQVNDWQTMAELLQNLGVKAEWNGDYAQANEYYQEGMTCALRIHNVPRISALLMNMGMLAFRQKFYTQAETYYQESLKLARKVENRMRESSVLQNLGMLAGARKQWKQAEAYLQESLKIATSSGKDWLRNETLNEIGELYLKQQRIDEAEAVFQEVLSKVRQMETKYLEACTQYGLARVEAARQNFAEAYRKGQASHALFTRLENVMAKQVGDWLEHMG